MRRFFTRRHPRPRFIKLGYFLWLVVPLGLWAGYDAFGLPHTIWSYSWIDEGQGMDPFAERHYTRCTFIGPYGTFTQNAEYGRCSYVKFFKAGAP
jgi:hypothetical protein